MMGKQAWRYAAFENNSVAIEEFCTKYGLTYRLLNDGYQIRIGETLDIYPVRLKWCWLPTGERGEIENVEELRQIMLDRLPNRERDIRQNYDGNAQGVSVVPATVTEEQLEERVVDLANDKRINDTPKWMTALYYLFVVLMVAMVLLGVYFLLTTIVQQ